MKEQDRTLPWTLVLRPKWKTDWLTKGISNTYLSDYVSRQTTFALVLMTPQKDKEEFQSNNNNNKKQLSDFTAFFQQSCGLVFEMGI